MSAGDRAEMAQRIKTLRKVLGLTQHGFAATFGKTQSAVARWETGRDEPGPSVLIKMGDLAAPEERKWWYERAGVSRDEVEPKATNLKGVPLLRDAVAAGMGRSVDESAVESHWELPRDWFPPGSRIVALKVVGSSMAPIVQEGYIVLVDVADRSIKKLIGQMVAAREGDGVTLKWLRKEGKFLQLVPQHTSRDHPVRIIEPGEESEFGIVGRVVKWIGMPPK
jgi:SOS-response transcriptional repressor LexA